MVEGDLIEFARRYYIIRVLLLRRLVKPEEPIAEPLPGIFEPAYCCSDVRFSARDVAEYRHVSFHDISQAKHGGASHAGRSLVYLGYSGRSWEA